MSEEAVVNVWRQHQSCTLCPLSQTRRNIVFGTGNPEAKILVVTDPPTKSQDRAGTHATGDIRWLAQMYKKVTRSKLKLESCAEQMLKRVFIVSATMCIPIRDDGERAGQQRAPLYKEIKACMPRLTDTIYAVDPIIILCFGSHARSAVFAKRTGLDTSAKRLEYVDVPGQMGIDVRYSALLATALSVAEDAGDYHYENGKAATVQRALTKALSMVDDIMQEDQP